MKNVLSISLLDYESFKGKMAVMKSIEGSVAFRFDEMFRDKRINL